jgi:hypothetical protein
MMANPDFQERAIHKDAGVERDDRARDGPVTQPPPPEDPDQSEAAFPPTEEDPAFDLIHVMDFHDIAQYEPDAGEPERTGHEAWGLYQAAGQGASSSSALPDGELCRAGRVQRRRPQLGRDPDHAHVEPGRLPSASRR